MKLITLSRGVFFALGFVSLCLTSSMAQTTFLNFNSAGQYTGNFNPWNDVGTGNGGNYSFEESTNDGVGGGGGVAVFADNDMTATYKTGSWNLATNGATILVSVMVYSDGLSSGDKVQLGIINTTANGLNANAGVSFESYRFIPSSATAWPLYEQYCTSGATSAGGSLGTVTVTTGHWYKFVVALTNTSGASGNLSAGCALYDYGTNGLTPGANLVTFSTAETHAGLAIATNTAVWPALRAFQDGGISAWDNFLVFTSNSAPVITLPLTHSTVAVNTTATFNVLADGPGTISYTWYTNGVLVAGDSSASFTNLSVSISFTNVTVVAANSKGSATNTAVVTVITPSLPQVIIAPATGIGATLATLNGQILSTGGVPTTVNLYYGPANGGTNAAAWANTVSLGLQTGAFAQTVGSLSSNTTYYATASAVNVAGTAWATPAIQFATVGSNPVSTLAAVLTYHNDNTRMGVNSNETILTPANVNTNTFGKLFSCTLDGFMYAQPLIMTNVNIPSQGIHNVVYAATEHDSVYAFDAGNGVQLWRTSFLGPNVTTVPSGNVGSSDITPEIGITSTPVIDPVSGTIYAEVKTLEAGTNYVHRLHALDITTGLERTNFNSPFVISCTNYPGNGGGDNDGKNPPHVNWNPLREHSRPALTLLNGVVYISYASHGDNTPYHGWLFGYNATNLAQAPFVYNSTPNGGEGGFWEGGGGPTVDAQGNLYLQTGNGTFDSISTITTTNNYSMSLIKFSTSNGITMVDFFAPSNAVSLSGGDEDLGSSAPLILPASAGSAAHPNLVLGGGKTSPIYLVDQNNMGRFNAGYDNIVQQFNGGPSGDRDITPAFFNNTLYIIDYNSLIGAYKITNALFNTTPVETPDGYDNKGGVTPCISANGTSNAIVWAVYNAGGESPSTPCILRAYNATNITQELYTSAQLPSRDSAGDAVKFTIPAIANGKVYVGAQYSLTVYGLTADFAATPVISPDGGVFTNSVTVTLSDTTSGASIYYTLDGSTPTTNSSPYTVPFVLTNSATVTAGAFEGGVAASGTASAGFLNSSGSGSGIGLLGAYWGDTLSSSFIAPGFDAAPTLTRIDPTVNFNWSSAPPATNIAPNLYVVQWTGSVVPQFSETYTFYTTTENGVLLWVNGQLLVNEWVDQSLTTWSGTINLLAQQRYNIVMDFYYQDSGDPQAQLFWSSPSTGPMIIIPESQLYPVSNPPPSITLTSPGNGAVLTAAASVTVGANAAGQYNAVSQVAFYNNGQLLGTSTEQPYALTTTGLAAGSYVLTAVATDTTGLASTSAPVSITVTSGSGLPYGLTNYPAAPAFYNMPTVFTGPLPAQLSLTGVFRNTPDMTPVAGLISYAPNVQLFSDNAQKVRYFSIPNTGAPYSPGEQIAYAPTGTWSFPAGTVFVKTFELQTNLSNPNSLLRLETRLLVRDTNGAVYGVTYKWRSDYSDADLLTNSSGGVYTNLWYYPSPSDCLQCHTAVANYVLGVNARQLNGTNTYANGVADNQLRALNRAGLFYPALNESSISNIEYLSALTNPAASYVQRARSYLDANCAQCHQPGGPGPTFDARYDTPLTNQNIINTPAVKGNLGYDNVDIVTPNDIWRSSLYDRMDVVNPGIQMPPLARNLIDTNAIAVMAAWIDSLGGPPTLPPPALTPSGGIFTGYVNVAAEEATNNATLYYTLDGSLPTTNSTLYTGPILVTNSVTVNINAWASGYTNSVVGTGQYTILPGIFFLTPGEFTNGVFQMSFAGPVGSNYVLQVSTNLVQWSSISTNTPAVSPFVLTDPRAPGAARFYRVLQVP
jgi:mono/diheme cytochrome c family protein